MADSKKQSARTTIGKHRFSVISGALACLASVLGKVAFDGETAFHLLARSSCEDRLPDWMMCNLVGVLVKGASFAGMIMVNAVMLSTFLKALQMSGSTTATVTNCATNFVLSGVSGRIIFGERLPVLWFCGATFVVLGVMLMVGSTSDKTGKPKPAMDVSPTKARLKRD